MGRGGEYACVVSLPANKQTTNRFRQHSSAKIFHRKDCRGLPASEHISAAGHEPCHLRFKYRAIKKTI